MSATAPTQSLSSSQGAQTFRLDDFEGPLDLLLYLVRKNEVNICDIPIASITEQFLAYINAGSKTSLDDLSEFYTMAATLLYIKSRTLLPLELDLEDEIEDPRQELIDKLIEYQRFRKLAELMEKREMEVEWSVERTKMQRQLPFTDDEELWKELDVWNLLTTFSRLVSSVNAERIVDLYEEVSINEKITLLNELLAGKHQCRFTDLVTRPHSTLDFVCSFLAVLELVKYRVIAIYQHRLFGDIVIRKREEEPVQQNSRLPGVDTHVG